jgi:hypothetical protein
MAWRINNNSVKISAENDQRRHQRRSAYIALVGFDAA